MHAEINTTIVKEAVRGIQKEMDEEHKCNTEVTELKLNQFENISLIKS